MSCPVRTAAWACPLLAPWPTRAHMLGTTSSGLAMAPESNKMRKAAPDPARPLRERCYLKYTLQKHRAGWSGHQTYRYLHILGFLPQPMHAPVAAVKARGAFSMGGGACARETRDDGPWPPLSGRRMGANATQGHNVRDTSGRGCARSRGGRPGLIAAALCGNRLWLWPGMHCETKFVEVQAAAT